MLRPYLRLVRLPNVFTACADIFTGYTLMCARFGPADWLTLAPLMSASAALYLSGMALNDLVDRDEDARFRPQRPIPSGAVSVAGATACAAALALSGLLLSGLVNRQAGETALFLAAAIAIYNLRAKKSFLAGPLVLGLCRFLNLQLGMAGHSHYLVIFNEKLALDVPWAPAFALGLYVAGVTAFSAQEETGARPRAMRTGWLLILGGAGVAALASREQWLWAAMAPLLLGLLLLSVRLQRARSPEAARALVRAGVMGICVWDAGLILGFAGAAWWPWALACVAALLPGFALARWLAQKEA